MTHREMIAGDLCGPISGTKFICDLPGPGPWHMCRWDGAIVSVSPNFPQMALIRDGIVTWVDPVAEIQGERQ